MNTLRYATTTRESHGQGDQRRRDDDGQAYVYCTIPTYSIIRIPESHSMYYRYARVD
jgi:hypothetical protein